MTTSETTPDWRVRALRVAVAFSLVAMLGWYSPWITATLWRVFHPHGRVRYRGLEVRVPWPWIADTDANREDPTVTPQGLSLRKMPPTMNGRLVPQSLFVTVISPDPGVDEEQQTERWLAAFRSSHSGAHFDRRQSYAVPASASCLSAEKPATPHDVIWTCISVRDGWVANFEGHDADEAVFFDIVNRLKR